MARHYYPAMRGLFGDWIYYTCLMPMLDVTKRLRFADEIHKSEKLSQWIQRKLKDGRSQEIASYLLSEKERFFNSLVVAIYQGDPAWHGFSQLKALKKDIDLSEVPDDVEASVGFLSFTGDEKLFAVDGQHRLAGMKEALASESKIGDDDVSLVIVGHQATPAGLRRTRRLFTTLNKTARPVGKGEIIALDENDVMAIVTRHLVETDPRFHESRVRFSQTDNLPADAKELTTIGNLYDVLTELFRSAQGAPTKASLKFIRPDDDKLAQYIEMARKHFSSLARYSPPLREYFDASDASAESVVNKYRHSKGGHILFRPLGLRLFTEVLGALLKNGMSASKAAKLVAVLPTELSKAPYREIVWLPNGTMRANGRTLCRDLLLHMIGVDSRPDELKKRYAKALGKETADVQLPALKT